MSTDTFEKLKSNRKIYRSSVTKLVNSIEGILKSTPVDIVSLEENFNLLKIKSNTLFEIDKDLDPLIPLTEYENEKITSSDYVDKISLALFRAEKKLKENSASNLEISSSNQNINVPSNEFKSVKLPK